MARSERHLAMLGKAGGVHVLNPIRRDAGLQELAGLGIGNALSTAQPDWQELARAIHRDSMARAAVDSIGGSASASLLGLLG